MDKTRDKNRAEAKYIRISAPKLRRIANLVRGKDLTYSLNILNRMPHKGARILFDVIHSAKANAVNNNKENEQTLIVSKIMISEGPKFKRFRARARGRAFTIERKTSHVYVALESTAPKGDK